MATIIAVIAIAAAIVVISAGKEHPGHPRSSAPGGGSGLSTTPGSYIGLYSHEDPQSYAGVTAFTTSTGVKPRVIVYYSDWFESFQAGFATTVARNGAVPLVQIDPSHINISAIAAGDYDSYLTAYASEVRAYRHPVILSFGHEMNGHWYTWGYTRTSPTAFVDAWRHIVTVFRAARASNVTWLWTINNIHKEAGVPSPRPWWPGNSYVTWVGIDGYYTSPSAVFASVFGPTIADVRTLTHKPILISETSAAPTTDQPAKITDLFAGVHLYGLLGFVWFDSMDVVDWRLTSSAAIATFRQEARIHYQPAP